MKKILFVLCVIWGSISHAQNMVYISNNALYFQNKVFTGNREDLLKLESSTGSPILGQPTNTKIAVVALMNDKQRSGTGIFVREKEGQWLQVTILSSSNNITVEFVDHEGMIGIKPANCEACWTYQYGYQKTIAPNGGIAWKEIYF